MKILLVAPKFPPDGTGGVENVVKMLCNELRLDGHSVSVVTRFHRTHIKDPQVHQIRGGTGEFGGYSQWAIRAWRELRGGDYDIIHFNGFEGQILSLFPLLGAPRVVHIHNSVTREEAWYAQDFIRHNMGQQIVTNSFRRAGLIISPTSVAKRDLVDSVSGINADKIRVIPNMVDTRYYSRKAIRSSLRETLGIDGKFVILYFGKIKRTKGIEDICRAYEMLRDKLDSALIIGGAPTATDKFARYLTERYPGVIFTGRVEDPRPFYAAADAFCIYTTGFAGGEVFPVALAEAMSMGLPIVCSDNPIFREVTCGNAVFAPPEDPGALARAFLELSRDPSRLQELAKASRALAESSYDIKKVAPQVVEAYESLVGLERVVRTQLASTS
jgi:glycosyltransferase involved in cell wall biosynthesis